jgi:ABC-type multidrug transport system fused ATPase/permease subunit
MKIVLNGVKIRTSDSVTLRLATYLFSGVLNSHYSLFTEQSTSEIITIINSHTIHSTICLESWINILNEIAFLTVVLGVFTIMNPLVSLIFISGFLFMGILIYIGLAKKINAYGYIHNRLVSLVYKFGFAVSNSIKDIKIMQLENKFDRKFSQIWTEYSQNYTKSTVAKSIPKDFSETLIFSGIISVCLYVLITKQDLVHLIPTLGVVAVSSMRFLPSFNQITRSYNEFKFYRTSLKMVDDLYTSIEKSRQVVRHIDMVFEKTLEIKNLHFSYGDKKILNDISVTIAKGSSIAFVGSSGAGKSTLLDVLVGLRKAESSEIFMDGKPIDPFETDGLKSRIGYVPQTVNLIDESIAFNISFERDYNIEKMRRVITIARLSDFISELKNGLDTEIGESGVRVSGGQRQRIGIARALYRDPEILIFDEATSSLDNVTERELISEIYSLSGIKTLIIVAHRLTTVENCDVIYLLDKGRIIAQGTHEELLRTCAVYQQMYAQQGVEKGIN